MRLIDADKLENEIVFNKLPHSVWELDAILTSTVSGQDTVDAIPVEWLREQLNKYECSTYEGIETVLELWERENETNRCR